MTDTLDVGDWIQLGDGPQTLLRVRSLLPRANPPAVSVMDHRGRMRMVPWMLATTFRLEITEGDRG